MPQLKQSDVYSERILKWYDANLRHLPWRVSPAQQSDGINAEAYHVWLSEIMLQQTTVAAVKSYFEKFLKNWPRLVDLSAAPLEDILKAWSGLGYYSRARNLKACADLLIEQYDGQFPQTAKELEKLPGIGSYTAAAIAAIAFHQPCAVVDANIERVISRLFRIETPLPKAKAEIRQACQAIVPIDRPGDFAQALMDLGASLCSIKKQKCTDCPLNTLCQAYHDKVVETLPKKAPKQQKQQRFGIAFVAISQHNKIYLQKRPEKGLLGGMSEVPNEFVVLDKKQSEEHAADALSNFSAQPFQADWHYQGQIQHVFTHFRLTLAVYKADNLQTEKISAARDSLNKSGFWVNQADIMEEALPTVMKKVLHKALPTLL